MPDKSTEEYLQLLHEQPITAYKLLRVFFAFLYQKGITSIKDTLEEYFLECRQQGLYEESLKPVSFKYNGIFQYSVVLDEAMALLLHTGLITQEWPSKGVIYLKYDAQSCESAFELVHKKYLPQIESLAANYIDR